MSNDEFEVADLAYCEEASYEADDEICCSSQVEDHDSICSSSCESDASWEEESNDGSECSYVSKGMSSISKSESEFPFQNCVNQLKIEICEEELSTQYEDKEVVSKDELISCVDECLEDVCSDDQ